MIGSSYRSKAAQAVLGPAHSPVIPAVLWTGWLGPTGVLVGMTGMTVEHAVFTPSVDGVTNMSIIDCGVAGAGWIIHTLGIFDGAAGALIAAAYLPADVSPAAGDPLSVDVGGLTFTVTA